MVTSTGAKRGITVTVNPTGGSGRYNYYMIELYKNGSLVGQSSDTNSNKLFVVGNQNGQWSATYEVHDSEGAVYNGTASATITVS